MTKDLLIVIMIFGVTVLAGILLFSSYFAPDTPDMSAYPTMKEFNQLTAQLDRIKQEQIDIRKMLQSVYNINDREWAEIRKGAEPNERIH